MDPAYQARKPRAAEHGVQIEPRDGAEATGLLDLSSALLAGAGTGPGRGDDMVCRAATTPLRQPGTGEEIASVVGFLLGTGRRT